MGDCQRWDNLGRLAVADMVVGAVLRSEVRSWASAAAPVVGVVVEGPQRASGQELA